MTDLAISPLQLKQLVFTKLHLEAAAPIEEVESRWAPQFIFEGTRIDTEVEMGVQEDQSEEPINYMMTMRIKVDGDQETRPPYDIAITAVGWFELAPVYPPEKRDEIVRVNGASMIMGAIREMVSMVSSRSAFGALTLPTLRFVPNIAHENDKQPDDTSDQE